MKRQLNIILQGNKGFFLPYTIWISMFVLLNLTTIIILYENNVYTNNTVNELVEIETLTQMTRAQFVQERLYEGVDSGEVNYHHPGGDVHVIFEWIDDVTVEANTVIATSNGTSVKKDFHLYFPNKAGGNND